MRPNQFTLAMISASLAAIAACSDATSPSRSLQSPLVPAEPPILSLTGYISATGGLPDGVVLRTNEGEEILLSGASTIDLTRVGGAEVEVRGQWVSYGAFNVADFVVRSVSGAPVMDGILLYEVVAIDPDTPSAPTYAIQLTRGGIVAVPDLPEALHSHIGARIWLAGFIDASPVAYGIIRE